jgi:calcineurin-like phosphoesterase family protein
MLKTFKLKTHGQFNVWLTSDTHFGHAKPWIVEKRGFNSVEAHDVAIINKLNELVQPNDYLFFCGDFCLNSTLDQFKSYCARINCGNIVFIAGNHNNPWWKFYKELISNQYGEDIEVYPFRWNNLIFVGESLDVEVDNFSFHLSHFPKLIWEKQHHGKGMGCGHSHSSCPKTLPDNKMGKIVDLGWDVWNAPVSLNEFKRVIKSKEINLEDHHNKNTT